MMPELARVDEEIDELGYSFVQNMVSAEFVASAREELVATIAKEDEYHGSSTHTDHGMVLLCSLYGGKFLELLDDPNFLAPVNNVLGEGCIVYAYTSSSMPPRSSNYSERIHVDCPRFIPGYITNVGVTLLLDDFTEDNGASWFLPRSHKTQEQPSSEIFYRDAKRLIAPAGSACYFNARTWHAGGCNKTTQWRHALTLNFCRPYMKQRIDIPRAMSDVDMTGTSELCLQKLGFFAQVPASYDEYYAPPHLRKFRQPTE